MWKEIVVVIVVVVKVVVAVVVGVGGERIIRISQKGYLCRTVVVFVSVLTLVVVSAVIIEIVVVTQ